MYKHLLVAIDDSELALGALDQALALAAKLEAKVTVVTVSEPWTSIVVGDAAIGFPIDDYESSIAKWSASLLSQAQSKASAAGVACETIHVKDSYPADGILATAKDAKCDLIVMGSHGRRGISRLLLGSQANNVLTQSTVPVLICR